MIGLTGSPRLSGRPRYLPIIGANSYLRNICGDLRKGKSENKMTGSMNHKGGALHKFFQPSSNADLNEDQGQEPDQMQENDHNLNTKI